MDTEMDQHNFLKLNDQELEARPEMLVAVEHNFMEINYNQPEPDTEPPVSVEPIETYERLKVEIIDLFQMLKITRSSSQHLALALQINPSLQLLRQFDEQVEEQIKGNIQQELEEFQQNIIWDQIAMHEIPIPWTVD
ncbi:hypothetical protein RHGRI_024586 [Rhododendron griersonianum]|uniref:Uncharacterized protein n=1 Tax=Rhododendron griersonianum TaxID=479676 RepID=A0AAV6JA08_9ERIC|nr:hypothetical protein RHGRI_024586 [Rhododendron griersonianum]